MVFKISFFYHWKSKLNKGRLGRVWEVGNSTNTAALLFRLIGTQSLFENSLIFDLYTESAHFFFGLFCHVCLTSEKSVPWISIAKPTKVLRSVLLLEA